MSKDLLDRRGFLSCLAGGYLASKVGLAASTVPRLGRETIEWDSGWEFQMPNPFDNRLWRKVNLPHDWSIEGDYSEHNAGGGLTGYLPSGLGWYRKELERPHHWAGKQVSIEFDGVFMNSTVWINGHELGSRPYGYISFAYDLTPYLKSGQNLLVVRVDNEKQPAARWYTGSGIYAHVRLVVTSPIHVTQWGTFVRTTDLREERATLAVTTEVRNDTDADARLILRATTTDSSGCVVRRTEAPIKAASGMSTATSQHFVIARPRAWSPDSPNLYQLKLQIIQDYEVVDECEVLFGIRMAGFNPDRGFLLNGSNVKLKGVADHYCAAGVGAAIPDALLEWQLRLYKKMGVNAIRTAHHPRPPIFYDLCDRLGLMVVNELFDGWHQKAEQDYGARFFTQWWQKDATDCIKRDRNHPSVILWSIGNETGDTDIHGIAKLIHSLDGTRAVTGGQVLYGVDVAGFNGPGGTPGTLEAYHKTHPERPIVLTEEPHTLQTRGFYRVQTWWRDADRPRYEFPPYGAEQIFFDGNSWYNSSYDNAGVRMTARSSWKRTESWPWLAGEFRWTGFDYLGEAGFDTKSWPARMWNYGVIDLAGIPKDAFYLYQAFWTVDPMVHLLPHWTHPGMNGVNIPMVAYSNAQEVELFLNEQSLGRRKPEPLGDFRWNVPYVSGKIQAVAFTEGKAVASAAFETASNPFHIQLEMDKEGSRATSNDLAVVTFMITDNADVMVPWAMNRIDFKITGPLNLLGFENGDPLDVTKPRALWRRVFYGVGRGFFHRSPENGPIELVAFGILGDTPFPVSTEISIAMNRCALNGALSPARFEIRYTSDGSEPDVNSALYTQPFSLGKTTHLRAVLLRDGKPFVTTQDDFIQGPKPCATDPRWQRQVSQSGPFAGPFDSRLVGGWRCDEMVCEIRSDGTLVNRSRLDGNDEGWWWYATPADHFEAPNDFGHGELRFSRSKETWQINLSGFDAQMLILKTKGKTLRWTRTK